MSRKAGRNKEVTEKLLLESAAKEFAAKGVDHAALRTMTQIVGLTTGAVYFLYGSKENLFNILVQSVTEPCIAFVESRIKTETTYMAKTYEQNEQDNYEEFTNFLKFYFENKNKVYAVMKNRDQKIVKDFFNRVYSMFEEHYMTLVNNIAKVTPRTTPIDEYMVKWYARNQIDSILEFLNQDFTVDEALQHARPFVKVMEKGFLGLL